MKTFSLFAVGTMLSISLFAQTPARKATIATVKKATTAKKAVVHPASASTTVPKPAVQVLTATPAPAPVDTPPTRQAAPVSSTPARTDVVQMASGQSQAGSSQIRFGIVLGGTFAKLHVTDAENSISSPTKTGFHAGLLVDNRYNFN